MYGEVAKTPVQQKADQEFIDDMIARCGSREKASSELAHRGWDPKNDLSTAMKRFNQAWLLDAKNAQAYWGMGVVMGRKRKYKESVELLQRAETCDPGNDRILIDLARSLFCQKDYAGAWEKSHQAQALNTNDIDPSFYAT